MTREQVYDTIKSNIISVLPEVSESSIAPERTLKDLGADSIDRADISTMSMENMDLRIPLVELGKVSTIGELVDLLYTHAQR